MLDCPVCMGLAGSITTELTELHSEIKAGNLVVEVVWECSAGHEFTARYDMTKVTY